MIVADPAMTADDAPELATLLARRLDLDLSPAQLASRLTRWSPPQPRYSQGVMAKYARLVSSASTGAVTGFFA